jgi:hypothetical protein
LRFGLRYSDSVPLAPFTLTLKDAPASFGGLDTLSASAAVGATSRHSTTAAVKPSPRRRRDNAPQRRTEKIYTGHGGQTKSDVSYTRADASPTAT